VGSTSAIVSVTAPPGGCTPVAYVISHAPAASLITPSLTTVPAAQPVTARLGNLSPGVTYSATATGQCADGTRTPPSAPLQFTPVASVSPPPPPPTCVDGIQNGAETDVDCGGGTCKTCGLTQGCKVNADCEFECGGSNGCVNFR
jgi:hypothetical protein